jgi:hypothetical protein
MDIEHRNDVFLTDADYWSRLGADLCFDPLLKRVHPTDFSLPESCPITYCHAPGAGKLAIFLWPAFASYVG